MVFNATETTRCAATVDAGALEAAAQAVFTHPFDDGVDAAAHRLVATLVEKSQSALAAAMQAGVPKKWLEQAERSRETEAQIRRDMTALACVARVMSIPSGVEGECSGYEQRCTSGQRSMLQVNQVAAVATRASKATLDACVADLQLHAQRGLSRTEHQEQPSRGTSISVPGTTPCEDLELSKLCIPETQAN